MSSYETCMRSIFIIKIQEKAICIPIKDFYSSPRKVPNSCGYYITILCSAVGQACAELLASMFEEESNMACNIGVICIWVLTDLPKIAFELQDHLTKSLLLEAQRERERERGL